MSHRTLISRQLKNLIEMSSSSVSGLRGMMERRTRNHSADAGVLRKTRPIHLAPVLRTIALTCLVLLTECKDYCHNQDFVAECLNPGEAILMETARYGRMRFGPCVREGFGYVGCFVDVIEHAHERCSGRKSCVIRVPDATLDQTRPCNDDLKSYLETTYTCISVADPESETCRLSLEPNQTYGYISSMSTAEGTHRRSRQPCGSPQTPWILSVPSGQRINITLMDFSSSSLSYDSQASTGTTFPVTTAAQTTSGVPCDLYAVIEEEKPTKRMDICGNGVIEQSNAFASAGELIKVTVFYRSEESARFILRYEAIGCPDVTQTAPNVWLKRETNRMMAGCVASQVTWQLACVGNRWEGSPINCSTVGSKDARREDGLASLSVGASILIILGVSLAIGLVVLLFGLYYMKRRREGVPIGVRGHQMRDLKPLSSDAAYEAASVYARNTAFEPVRVATHQRSGKGVTVDEGNEYEYVWDIPSNMMTTAKATRTSDQDSDEAVGVAGHARPPDLIRAERRAEGSRTLQKVTQCSCLADPTMTKHRSSTLAKPRDIGSTPGTRFASLESRSRMGGRRETDAAGRKTMDLKRTDGGLDSVRVCRHCGHSVTDPPSTSSAGAMRLTPNSATMARRPFPGPSATTTTRPTIETTSGKRSGTTGATVSRASTVSPTTLPRTHRH